MNRGSPETPSFLKKSLLILREGMSGGEPERERERENPNQAEESNLGLELTNREIMI